MLAVLVDVINILHDARTLFRRCPEVSVNLGWRIDDGTLSGLLSISNSILI